MSSINYKIKKLPILIALICCVSICLIGQNTSSFNLKQSYEEAERLYQRANSPKSIYAAIKAYERIICFSPTFANAYLRAGYLYSRLVPWDSNAYGKALRCYNKYAELNPDNINMIVKCKKELNHRNNIGLIDRVSLYLSYAFQSLIDNWKLSLKAEASCDSLEFSNTKNF